MIRLRFKLRLSCGTASATSHTESSQILSAAASSPHASRARINPETDATDLRLGVWHDDAWCMMSRCQWQSPRSSGQESASALHIYRKCCGEKVVLNEVTIACPWWYYQWLCCDFFTNYSNFSQSSARLLFFFFSIHSSLSWISHLLISPCIRPGKSSITSSRSFTKCINLVCGG